MECIKLMRVFLHWKSIFIVLILMILILFINESLNVNVFDLLLDQFTTTKSKIESIGMSGESWRTYNNLHETSVSIQHKDCNTCHDFFGLWPSDCVDNYDSLVDKIKTISTQMVAMSANFTLMTTSPNKCTFKYPNINTLVFNTTEILLECGFESAISKIDSWKKSRFTRMSDILRICLASKYRMAYMDTDVHYLHLNKTLFECTYAGAQMWGNYRNAIEITNSAFCLPPAILHDMSRYQLNRIVRGGDNYFYTELGPSMFHNVLMNRHSVSMYSQNHPSEASVPLIARSIRQFGHTQLHLTGHVRKGNPDLSFSELVNKIRHAADIPKLDYTFL